MGNKGTWESENRGNGSGVTQLEGSVPKVRLSYTRANGGSERII